jgi:protein O-mannosyl-transferase
MVGHMSRSNRAGVFLLFCLLILGGYGNTFHTTWHLDDKPNILTNTHLHIQDLKPATLATTLYSNPKNPYEPAKKMYRPVACLSFALNWYFGQDDPFGYHVVNIVLHILTAFVLYIFIQHLYATPLLEKKSAREKQLVPILAAALWAVNPIQIQAVTYIVQRMAVLGALFYLLGLWAYVKGRMSTRSSARLLRFMVCFACYLLALGSKENTLVMPLTLILMEFSFFRSLKHQRNRMLLAGVVAVSALILFLIGTLLFLKGDPGSFLKAYAFRPYTLTERLMTEARVLVHYLSQIFIPLPDRFSIEHDVLISTTFFQPWTTFPAIMFLCGWLITGAWLLIKHPLVGFSMLFFLVNHLVESSVIPLELIFEHRNYLPSFLLFAPVGVGLNRLLDGPGGSKTVIRPILYGVMVLVVVGFVGASHIRNKVWATERSLWQDAALKAPNSARPFANLAWDMAFGTNANPVNFDKALKLYGLALQRRMPKWGQSASILVEMANIYTLKKEYPKAIQHLERAIHLNPDNAKARYDLASQFLHVGRWKEASDTIDPLLSSAKVHEGYLNLKAIILIRQGRAGKAIPYLEKSLHLEPYFQTTLLYMGMAHNLTGEHATAEQILLKARSVPPANLLPILCLVDNSLRAGAMDKAMYYVDSIGSLYQPDMVGKNLAAYQQDGLAPPLKFTEITRMLSQRLPGFKGEKSEP